MSAVGHYLVLGLLLDGPASGYELGRKAFESVAYFWPITRSHIYAELPKLVDRGYATAIDVPQRGAPDKRVFTATEVGHQAFRDWLISFDAVAERAHQPLQIQLHFGHHASSEHLNRQLDRWEEEVRHTLAYCTELLHRIDPPGEPVSPRGLTALFAIRRAEADLDWLTEARAALNSSID